jgi:hypothetical protein
VFHDSWRELVTCYSVVVPALQDERALEGDQLAALLADAGFTLLATQSFSVSRRITVGEAVQALLLTYLPDLLPSAGYSELLNALERALTELSGEDGTVDFVVHADLVTARRR